VWQYAAPVSVTNMDPAQVRAGGDLLIISPNIDFAPGFFVEPNGKLSVISSNPAALIPNP